MKRLLPVLFWLTASGAHAHFSLLSPASIHSTDNGGKGDGPCGEGVESNIITEVQGGRPLPVQIREFVFHPGHYRVALAVKSRAELPPDPPVQQSGFVSVSASIQNPVRPPLLADGMFSHTSPPSGDFRGQVVLPNLDCERCTLQVIEFMAEHSEPFFYRHCADLKIKSDPSLPPADAAWPRNLTESRPAAAILPLWIDGGGWRSSMTLINLDSSAASFTVRFWGDNGSPWELPGVAAGGTIRPFGSQTIETDGSPPVTPAGWAEITGARTLSLTAMARAEDATEVAIPVMGPAGRRFVLPFESGPGLSVELSVVNPGADDDAVVTVTLLDEQGQIQAVSEPVPVGRRQRRHLPVPVPGNGALPRRGVIEIHSPTADILAVAERSSGGRLNLIPGAAK